MFKVAVFISTVSVVNCDALPLLYEIAYGTAFSIDNFRGQNFDTPFNLLFGPLANFLVMKWNCAALDEFLCLYHESSLGKRNTDMAFLDELGQTYSNEPSRNIHPHPFVTRT